MRTWTSRSRRFAVGGTAVALVGLLFLTLPAWKAAAQDRELSAAEARQVERWWDEQTLGESLALSDMPMGRLQEAAEAAWAAGVRRIDLRTALFSDAAREVFAGNAAAGEGRPSPYLEYFTNNPTQLGRLGEFLEENATYVVGPGGTQDEMFAAFEGLRDSYLASLGLEEMDGRVVDPRAPHLTPYFASRFLGAPRPLEQPESALNVG